MNRITRLLLGCLPAFTSIGAFASEPADFNKWFADSTLRATYTFAGGGGHPAAIYLSTMETQPGWAGRRGHLAELPLKGNGQIYLTDEATGDTIYANSFTLLFHEWIVTDEAKTTPRSFEYSFLLPKPRTKARLHVSMIDNAQQPIATTTHPYDPVDILVRQWSGTPLPHRYLHRGGDPKDVIDVALVAEGYTAGQDSIFYDDARKMTDAILAHEPFKSMSSRFNFVAVMTPSADGEVSHPKRGEWHSTRYDSHYSTLYSDRYHTTPSSVKVHEDLRGIPYEHLVMVVNTEQYGGGGFYNCILTAAAHHPTMPHVATHEFGHSFGGLADEYFYDNEDQGDLFAAGVEPWEQNITNLADFEGKKPHWKAMLKEGTPIPTPQDAEAEVGLFEGAGYMAKGMYRPAFKCRMRVNDYPDFCPVCTDALTRLILFYTEQ